MSASSCLTRSSIRASVLSVVFLVTLHACSDEPASTIDQSSATSNQSSSQTAATTAAIADNAIAGTVSSINGPEAGVWVIAETGEFDTFFAKIVVTDDDGNFELPDLPEASYQVWVRGYGLADSPKTTSQPGASIDLTALVAADAAQAAEVYPAAYWYSMMGLPSEEELAGVAGGMEEYLTWMKNMGCVGCHQLGQLSTRTLPEDYQGFETHEQAWTRRVQSGQAGAGMLRQLTGRGDGIGIKYLADWTQRIEDGELPFATPDRPSGIERDVVLTVRDWSNQKAYMHDLSGTDRRDPTVNAYGPVYGAPELSTDEFPVLDPVTNTHWVINAPVRDADTPTTNSTPPTMPSAYWGDEAIWDSKANAHNPMLDQDGRVWYTARIRAADNPDFCKEGSDHPSAQLFPTERAGRQLSVYDPATEEYTFVDTCYSTHHLQFAYDDDNTLWTSGGGQVVGWINTKEFLETGDAAAAQGWSPLILDTNGNGEVDEWTEPGQPLEEGKDARVPAGFYAVMPDPADGSVWGSQAFGYPGALVRFDPATGLGEKFNVPMPGYGSRGADIDKNGVVWVSLGSGHLGEFDRRKCVGPLNGPTATGDHCPEGWSFHQLPGPGFRDLQYDNSIESSYYTWVDQHNSLGLGEDVPIVTGNLFDGVHAFVDGEFQTLRVPYPLGFYTKGLEGRIDDPDGGWNGRGLWVPSGDRVPWLKEGGQGTKPLVVQMQVRN